MIRLIFAGMILLCSTQGKAQLSPSVDQLIAYSRDHTPPGYSPHLKRLLLAPKGNYHYLFPFYNAFKDEDKYKKIYTEKGYYDELSQYFAFAGDYQAALDYLARSYDSVNDAIRRKVFKTVDALKDVAHVDARRYIRFAARDRPVVMINESYEKPMHRAFMLSLLGDFYKMGYRYLAMEMLNNFAGADLGRVNIHTGYYTAEPIAGELVRQALVMGFKLVAYEDTLADHHTPSQRDSAQAANIYQILREDSSAKIMVYAGNIHIGKQQEADGFVPMALAFKRISGIDPLTIDQTDMTEESNFGYGRVLYQAYIQKFPIKTASVPMINNIAVNVTDADKYDVTVVHPPTTYVDGRPAWLSLGGLRKPTSVKPISSLVFMVQAYYEDEVDRNDHKPWQLVPADQTYIQGGKKNYTLYLRKGKYVLYFRDIDYHILGNLNIEVD